MRDLSELKYLRYLIVHKWFVMVECFREGLYWRGIVHDLSKFLPSEFFPYAKHFYGNETSNNTDIKNNRFYKSADSGDKKFDFAWLVHQKRNKHHWQWWTFPNDGSGILVIPIKEPYLTEMICDWIGSGRAQGHPFSLNDRFFEARNWYLENGHKMQLAQETREIIEQRLKI